MADPEIVDYLARQAQQGDKEAFSRVVRLMMKDVTALIYRMTRNREATGDLAQETFVAAWENRQQFRGEAGFSSWLYRIAVNKVLNYLKQQSGRPEVPLSAVDDTLFAASAEAGNPETQLLRRQMRSDVLAFMAQLPPQQALVFDLRFYKQLSFGQIANLTGKAVGTVKTHYREAVRKLRVFAREKEWQP